MSNNFIECTPSQSRVDAPKDVFFYVFSLKGLLLMEMPDGLRPVMQAKLLIQIGDVPLQCSLSDDQFLCQFLIGESHRKQLQDLALTACQHWTVRLTALSNNM